MREFVQTLSEFKKGLRKDSNMPRNTGLAVEAYNTRAGVAGLEVPPLIVYPITDTPTVSWPLPQLVKITDLYLTSSGLYFINYAAGIFIVSSVAASTYALTTVYSGAGKSAYATPYVWNGTGTWINAIPPRFTVADFGYYQIWSHPALTIKRAINVDLTAYEWTNIIIGLNGSGMPPSVRCVCNFRGQLIAGMYSMYDETVGGTVDNFVAWSEIGSVTPTVMFSSSQYYIDRTIDLGGLARDPHKGTSGLYKTGPTSPVYRVLPLGKAVVVYCKDKIFAMIPVAEPVPTFAIVPIHNFGVAGTWLVDGDEYEHAYVDSSGRLWRINAELKPELLDHREYINTLTIANIVVSKNVNYADYYISDGVKCYLLSPFGLTQWFQYPTSIVYEDSNKRLIGPIAVGADVSASIATDVIDFGVRGMKTITALELGSGGQNLTANIDYRYKMTESFTASRFKTVNPAGGVAPIVSGTEFRIRVKGTDYTKFDLDYINVRLKYIDKRMIRGVYATDAKVLPRSSG